MIKYLTQILPILSLIASGILSVVQIASILAPVNFWAVVGLLIFVSHVHGVMCVCNHFAVLAGISVLKNNKVSRYSDGGSPDGNEVEDLRAFPLNIFDRDLFFLAPISIWLEFLAGYFIFEYSLAPIDGMIKVSAFGLIVFLILKITPCAAAGFIWFRSFRYDDNAKGSVRSSIVSRIIWSILFGTTVVLVDFLLKAFVVCLGTVIFVVANRYSIVFT